MCIGILLHRTHGNNTTLRGHRRQKDYILIIISAAAGPAVWVGGSGDAVFLCGSGLERASDGEHPGLSCSAHDEAVAQDGADHYEWQKVLHPPDRLYP